MPEFIENAIMLYRKGGNELIDGKKVECKTFDRDSPTFEEDSKGWSEHDELWASMEKPAKKTGSQGTQPNTQTGGQGQNGGQGSQDSE